MEFKLNRVERIGILLIQHKKLSRDDIAFLVQYYKEESAEKKLTEEELINADPRTLSSGYKSYRTNLRRMRGLDVDYNDLVGG